MSHPTTLPPSRSTGLYSLPKTDANPLSALKFGVTVNVFADVCKVRVPISSPHTPPPGRAERPIIEFTRKSRKAMLEKLAKLRNPSGGVFITLTYPGLFEFTPEQCKKHLERFRKAFLRRFPHSGVFWRMELKERRSGASRGLLVPHFHMLCFFYADAMPIVEFREWLRVAWWRSVGSGDEAHLRAGTQADLIMNRAHAGRYASKYAAKEEDSTKVLHPSRIYSWGRRWGTFGNLDLAEAFRVTLTMPQFYEFRRYCEKLLRSKGRAYAKRIRHGNPLQGFTVFGLGDQTSECWRDQFDSTVSRLLLSL